MITVKNGVTQVVSEKISTRAMKRPELETAGKLAGKIRSSGVAVTLVVQGRKRLGRGIGPAMRREHAEARASHPGTQTRRTGMAQVPVFASGTGTSTVRTPSL